MAEYFKYITTYNNTLVDRSDTTFSPVPPYGEILSSYYIVPHQELYYYKESGGEIVLNDAATIESYLEGTDPPPGPNDIVEQNEFTGYTESTDNNIDYLSGQTDTKLNTTDFNTYSGDTDLYIETKIDKVTGATSNLAIFSADGNVVDSNVTVDSITGGTGYYVYGDKEVAESNASPTPVTYYSTGGTLTEGLFSLDYLGILGNSVKVKPAYIQFFHDDRPISSIIDYAPPTNGGYIPISFMKDEYLTGGTHTFDVRYHAGVNTALMNYAAIRVRKVQ